MTRNRNSKATNSTSSTIATAPKGTDTPKATPAASGVRLVIVGDQGRRSAAESDAIAAAFDMLSAAVLSLPRPKATPAPQGASQRVRAAFAADDAARVHAFDLLRAAVANGRAIANGR